ncbi:conserved hypothetical protein [Ricinus communis]|uniref:Uncharacterized protein n=1 Tax=Ricinus communis TaxID=3988 RepID=B9SZD7_RICCO|nr:conserved hypothetical protein [Ricinus communis]
MLERGGQTRQLKDVDTKREVMGQSQVSDHAKQGNQRGANEAARCAAAAPTHTPPAHRRAAKHARGYQF